jgi:hypothetical protein
MGRMKNKIAPKRLQAETAAELDALLDHAFKGEL